VKIHHFSSEQRLNTTLAEAWSIFSKPASLNAITPPQLKFTIADDPGSMYPGQLILFRIRICGLPCSWLTEITQVEEGRSFIDEQRLGPYRFWHHRHEFQDMGDHVLMRDQIHYALPCWPLGEIAHPLIVRPMLKRIFAFRRQTIDQLFNKGEPKPGPAK